MRDRSSDSISKYIENEKDISRYKISILEKTKSPSASQKRILTIENEFLSIPWEKMEFEDVAAVAAAISIYRTSRSQFFSTYNLKSIDDENLNRADLTKSIEEKICFIKKTAFAFKNLKPQEINLIQNSELYYDLVKKISQKNNQSFEFQKKILDSKDLAYLQEIEPVVILKKRARCQAALYSIGQYLDSVNFSFSDSLSLEQLIMLDSDISNLFSNLDKNIFCYYNEALLILKSLLNGTMGHNTYIEKIYSLQNLLSFNDIFNTKHTPSPLHFLDTFPSDEPVITNIMFESKNVISTTLDLDEERNIQNKVFGILLPIPREGNEKMSLLYKEIYYEDYNISHLFSDDLSNVVAKYKNKKSYYKAILMHPFWKLHKLSKHDPICRKILMQLIRLDGSEFENTNFNDLSVINNINNTHSGFINISSKSRALTAKTRSEEEGISEIYSIIKSKVLEIKEDFNILSLKGKL